VKPPVPLEYFTHSEKGLCVCQALFISVALANTKPPAQYPQYFCCIHLLSTGPLPGPVTQNTVLFPLQTDLVSCAGFPPYFLSDSAGVTSAKFSLPFLLCLLLTLLSEIPAAPPQLQVCRAPVKAGYTSGLLPLPSNLLPKPHPSSSADSGFYFFQRLLTQWLFHTSPLELEQAKLLPDYCLHLTLFFQTEGLHVAFPLETTQSAQLDGLLLHNLTF